jgi:hypothetical protein
VIFALAELPWFPLAAAGAASRLEIRAGYETDPDGAADPVRGDAWAAVTLGSAAVRETNGPLSLSLDGAVGATAYARLTELDRLSLLVTPALEYVVSPRVGARLTLGAEGQLVSDDNQSAWGWSGSLRFREQLGRGVDLAEYVSYRELTARRAEYSGKKAAVGLFLRVFLGTRWLLGVGGEYAHGDFQSSDGVGSGIAGQGMGGGRSMGPNRSAAPDDREALVAEDEDRLLGSLALVYEWSAALSTGVEYGYTRVQGVDGTDDQQSVVVSATYSF